MRQILIKTDKGIYCPEGDFYIDPVANVDYAVITHAHSDHLRPGMKHYLAHKDSSPVIRLRLGRSISLESIGYEEVVWRNGVKISLHPAGHVVGSAQIRVEHRGQVAVVSGDYKLEQDGLSVPFSPVKCNLFITESTFGLPVYTWRPQADIFAEIHEWWRNNQQNGLVSVLAAYSLGKAQRILVNLNQHIGKVYVQPSIAEMNAAISSTGIVLPQVSAYTIKEVRSKSEKDIRKEQLTGLPLVIVTPGVLGSSWLERLERLAPFSVGYCSGWMQIRGAKSRLGVDQGFVISDHADWGSLVQAVKNTVAEKVLTTHGYTSSLARYLNEVGIAAAEL